MVEQEDFIKHEAICELLDLDLTCPHCNEVLVKADERKGHDTSNPTRSSLEKSKRE